MPELRPLIEDLVAGNHILYRQGIVDGYGHISFRHPDEAPIASSSRQPFAHRAA